MDELLVDNGDITLRVEVTGDGPTILCVHGWPEAPHSWRHQAAHFSERGYQVAAMDVRGYGGSSAPPEIKRYTLRELASDVAAVAEALDDEPVILFGHDWGAPIAWHAAIRHPDRVRAVAGLSVPHTPPMPLSLIDLFDQLYADKFFYMLSFQEPGVIESQFAVDTRAALKKVYYGISGDNPGLGLIPDGPRNAALLSLLPEPPDGPLSFMTDADLDAYAATFARAGTTGAFNRYRALDFDVEANADIMGATVDQPSCFIAGERDSVRHLVPGVDGFADPGSGCTDFRGSTIIPGAGHWVQQEAPSEVNAALDEFLATLQ
ncbi:MAG TPA: alpha/beta hydrolase [Ilumatobacteraceae bacterium]|nr:alpha/beta hydrolase [Ilumatobacteraceae bacterium]